MSAYTARNEGSFAPRLAIRSAAASVSGVIVLDSPEALEACDDPETRSAAAILSTHAATVSGAARFSAALVALAGSLSAVGCRVLLSLSSDVGIERGTEGERSRQSSSYRLGSYRSSPAFLIFPPCSPSTTTTVLVPRRLLTPAFVGSLNPSYANNGHLTNDSAAVRLAVLTRTGRPTE